MRKKYLSALLFGALLVTSAGTFTSCKDYDDDINNLQGQIDEIKTTLSELESQIGVAGVSSVTFDEATGVLTVVDGNGTKTYKIQTSAEAKVEAEITADGKLVINGEEIGTVAGGDKVTVDDEGNLLVNDEVVGKLGNGTEVSMIKDEANKTVTIKVGNDTVTLPMNAEASAVGLSEVEITANTWTAGRDYAWAAAQKDIEWGGVLGNVKTGDLLIGGLSSSKVKVTPINYDLSSQKLTLVDQFGGTANVKITATADWQSGVASRASSPNGEWYLSFVMDETITAENIATAFTKEVNGVDMNLKYALAVNGVKMTGYDFVIDTQTENESKANAAINKDNVYIASATYGQVNYVGIGGDALYVGGNGSNKVVDSYIKFEGLAASQAESMGVTANGMVVSAPATAAGKEITGVSVYILDVTGTISKKEVNLTIASTSVTTTETASPVTIKVTTDKKFTIDLGTIFQNMDANVVLNAESAILTCNDPNFFAQNVASDGLGHEFVTNVVAQNIEFKKADNGTVTFGGDLRSVTKAVVTLPADANGNYQTGATNIANIYGAFNLDLYLLDGSNNAIKHVVVPVTVTKPEFSDYYTENSYAGWNNGTLKHVITSTDNVSLSGMLFNYKKNTDNQDMIGVQPYYIVTYKDYDNAEQKDKLFSRFDLVGGKILKETGASTGMYELKVSSLKAKAKQTVANVKLTSSTGAISATETPIEVSKEFTLNLVQQFADVKVVYFTNNVAGDKAIVVDQTIAGYDNKEPDPEKPANYNGLAFQYGTSYVAAQILETGDNAKLNGFTLITEASASKPSGSQINVSVAKEGSSLGNNPEFADSGITVTGLNPGQGGKMKFTFVDNAGIITTASIEYVKQ